MENPTSVNLVPGITSVKSFPLYAQIAQSTRCQFHNLLCVLYVRKVTRGEIIPAPNVLVIKWETEFLAQHVQQDQCHSTPIKKLAGVRRVTDGNGVPAMKDPVKVAQQTSIKTKNREHVYNVLMKPPPCLSLKTAGVQLDCLGMDRAV